jgi:hypothetical protein
MDVPLSIHGKIKTRIERDWRGGRIKVNLARPETRFDKLKAQSPPRGGERKPERTKWGGWIKMDRGKVGRFWGIGNAKAGGGMAAKGRKEHKERRGI